MKIILMAFSFLFTTKTFSQNALLVVGTYDSPKSEGIYVYKFNSLLGSANKIDFIKTSNPSYLAVSSDHKTLFAVNENADANGKGGGVTSFSVSTSGSLTKISSQSSEGNHPCYIAIDKTGKWIIAANYTSGNFTVLPIKKSGTLGKASQVIQEIGKSIDTLRQNSPHVHTVFFSKNNEELYVTDLGTDKIMLYDFNDKTGKVTPSVQKYLTTEPGSGPRHIDISQTNIMYVLQELTGKISVFAFKNKQFKNIQTVSSLPSGFSGIAGSADIHVSPDGNFLYASNRGESNTIAIYRINKKTGKLTLLAHQSTLGMTPRNFNFDPSGNFLLVANQNSDEVVIFKRNIKSGLLTDTGNRISVGKPVCIKWL